jgi:hypothetical protein
MLLFGSETKLFSSGVSENGRSHRKLWLVFVRAVGFWTCWTVGLLKLR